MNKLIKEIIEDALWAPTADNMQNWNISNTGENYTLKIDTDIEVHPLDYGYNCSVFAIGGFCEYLIIAANKRGYSVEWKFDIENLSLSFSFQKSEEKFSNTFYEYLRTRRTDRRPYSKLKLDNLVKTEVLSTNGAYKSKIAFLEKDNKILLGYLSKVEKIFFNSFDAFYATLKWVNLEVNSLKNTGMNIENVGVKPVEAIFLKLMLPHKELLRFFVKLVMKRVLLFKSKMNIKKSGEFIILSVDKNENKNSYFEVGRHAIKSWLVLTKYGISAQPLSLGAISCLDLQQEKCPELVSKNRDFFKTGQILLQKEFNLEENQIPVWILRIGVNKNSTKLYSNRLSISDVLK